MRDGRRFGRPADPHTPPAEPTGTINTADHDSRIVRTQGQPAIQGYDAQAAVNEEQPAQAPQPPHRHRGSLIRPPRRSPGTGYRLGADPATHFSDNHVEKQLSEAAQLLLVPDECDGAVGRAIEIRRIR
jgi:hypothetical protein